MPNTVLAVLWALTLHTWSHMSSVSQSVGMPGAYLLLLILTLCSMGLAMARLERVL